MCAAASGVYTVRIDCTPEAPEHSLWQELFVEVMAPPLPEPLRQQHFDFSLQHFIPLPWAAKAAANDGSWRRKTNRQRAAHLRTN